MFDTMDFLMPNLNLDTENRNWEMLYKIDRREFELEEESVKSKMKGKEIISLEGDFTKCVDKETLVYEFLEEETDKTFKVVLPHKLTKQAWREHHWRLSGYMEKEMFMVTELWLGVYSEEDFSVERKGKNTLESAVIKSIENISLEKEKKPRSCKVEIQKGEKIYLSFLKTQLWDAFVGKEVWVNGYTLEKTTLFFTVKELYIKVDAMLYAFLMREDGGSILKTPGYVEKKRGEDEGLNALLDFYEYKGKETEQCADDEMGSAFEGIVTVSKVWCEIAEKGSHLSFTYENKKYTGVLSERLNNTENFMDVPVRVVGHRISGNKVELDFIAPDIVCRELMDNMGFSAGFTMKFSDLVRKQQRELFPKLKKYIADGGDPKEIGENNIDYDVRCMLDFESAKKQYLLCPELYPDEVRAEIETGLSHLKNERMGNGKIHRKIISTLVSFPYRDEKRAVDENEVFREMKCEIVGNEKQIRKLIKTYNSEKNFVILAGEDGIGKRSLVKAFGEAVSKPVIYFPLEGLTIEDTLFFGASRNYDNAEIGRVARKVFAANGACILVFTGIDRTDPKILDSITSLVNGIVSDLFLEVDIPVPLVFSILLTSSFDKVPSEFMAEGVEKIQMENYTAQEKQDIICKKMPKLQGLSDEVMDYMLNSAISGGVGELISDFQMLEENMENAQTLEVNTVKRILDIDDGMDVSKCSSIEVLLHYYRFHKEKYSDNVKVRIEGLYKEYRNTGKEMRNIIEKQLLNLLRIRDGKCVKSPWDVKEVRRCLDATHFGMEETKEAIMRALILLETTGRSKGILIHGAPGIGKTSLFESLANSLNIPFRKISCNGAHSADVFKGTSPTIKDAMSGKIASAIASAGTKRMLLLLDEIDKMKDGQHGNPYDALHDLFDSNIVGFEEEYLGVSLDLDGVIFVCTANNLDSIPGSILDRLELIEVSGYTTDEKKAVATEYVIPKVLKAFGEKHHFSEEAVDVLVNDYCPGVGIRDIYKKTESMLAAMKISGELEDVVEISSESVKKYCGAAELKRDWYPNELLPGCVRILSVSGNGMGSTSAVEVCENVFGTENKVTGLAEGSARESIDVALLVCSRMLKKKIESLHIHFGNAGIKKDGPSGGVSLSVAILSYMLQKEVPADIGFTGELDLFGNIMAVGGVESKLAAAENAGFKCVYLPAECYRYLKESDKLKRFKMQVKPVKNVKELAVELFGENAFV